MDAIWPITVVVWDGDWRQKSGTSDVRTGCIRKGYMKRNITYG
jgi:hypothetical protein